MKIDGKAVQLLRRNRQVSTRVIGDEMILVPIQGELAQLQEIFVLNSVGAYIWEHLDESEELETLQQALVGEFEVEEEEARLDLLQYLEELESRRLVLREEIDES